MEITETKYWEMFELKSSTGYKLPGHEATIDRIAVSFHPLHKLQIVKGSSFDEFVHLYVLRQRKRQRVRAQL